MVYRGLRIVMILSVRALGHEILGLAVILTLAQVERCVGPLLSLERWLLFCTDHGVDGLIDEEAC